MKKLKKSILIFILVVSFVIGMCFNSSAFVKIGSYQMVGGIGQSGKYARCYWYDEDDFSSTWQLRIDHAMNAWCTTGSQGCGIYTSAYVLKATAQSESVIDFHKTTIGNGVGGQTFHYTGVGSDSKRISPEKQNWVWSWINIDAVALNNFTLTNGSSMTAAQKRATVEHEIGHAFGLNENNSLPSSIMCQFLNGKRIATQPSADDCNGIIDIYGEYKP